MRIGAPVLYLLGLLFYLIPLDSGLLQAQDYFIQRWRALDKTLKDGHYSPRKVDDSLSAFVFAKFLESLDPDKKIFLKSDSVELSAHIYRLDDNLIEGDDSFIKKTERLLASRMEELLESWSSPNALSLQAIHVDTVTFLPYDARPNYLENPKERLQVWQKKIMFLSLLRAMNDSLTENQYNQNKLSLMKEVMYELSCELKNRYEQLFGVEREFENLFLSSWCSYFDPHTSFFSPTERSSFIEDLSSRTTNIGFLLAKDLKGNYRVTYLQPGSTVWKEKKINEGDQVISIKSGKDFLELKCTSLEDIYAFISDEAHRNFEFNLVNGQNVSLKVNVRKEEIPVVQNLAETYVLEGSRRVGYLSLPSFYTNYEVGMGSANEIAKELMSLSKEGLDGLILDLRDDGGGSLWEATSLASLFLDSGPIVLLDYRGKRPELIKAPNRGALYKGPMVVLVDHGSASAAELLASCLQDHQRALIVGGITFGKATIQHMVPIDEVNLDWGYLNLTIARFFRPNRGSVQAQGVIPDIIIHDPVLDFDFFESDLEQHLPNMPAGYGSEARAPKQKNRDFLIRRSKKRQNQDISLMDVRLFQEKWEEAYSTPRAIPVDWQGVQEYLSQSEYFAQQITEIRSMPSPFKVRPSRDRVKKLSDDDIFKSLLERRQNEVDQDYMLREAYSILVDAISKRVF